MSTSTSLGTLFIATEAGLYISRDNGRSFQVRNVGDGLGSDRCLDVVADGSNVYVATDHGLSISRDNGLSFSNFTFESTVGELPSNHCRKVKHWSNKLVVTTDHGAAISLDDGESFKMVRSEEGKLPSNDAKDAFIRGSMFVITTALGLAVSNNDGETFEFHLNSVDCRDIVLSPLGYFLVAGSLGVYRANATLSAFLGPLRSGVGNGENIKSLFVDEEGVLFLVTANSLYTSTDNADTFVKKPISVDGVPVNAQFSDIFVRRNISIDVTKIGQGYLVNTDTWFFHAEYFDADLIQVGSNLSVKFFHKERTPLWVDAVFTVNGALTPLYKPMVFSNGTFSTSLVVLAGQTISVKFRYESVGGAP